MPIAPYSDLGGSTIIKNNITWHVQSTSVNSTSFKPNNREIRIFEKVCLVPYIIQYKMNS